ncbi:MAG: NAD+ synthase [Kosmotogaceae bacterium]
MIIRIGLAQINTVVGNIEQNLAKMKEYINKGQDKDVDIIVFPELTITGYPPEDLLYRVDFVKENLSALEVIKDYTSNSDITVIAGFVDFDTELYNAAAVIQNGELIGVHRKNHLPNYTVFDERRYFSAGNDSLILTNGRIKFGVNICEDIWVPAGPGHDQTKSGANLLLNLSASPFMAEKHFYRLKLLQTRANEYSCAIGYCNQVGGQDELVFDGRSAIVLPNGKTYVAADFEEELLIGDIDPYDAITLNLVEGKRKSYTIFKDVNEKKISLKGKSKQEFFPDSQEPIWYREEEVFKALVTGLRDYLVKNDFKKVALGLSGGLDSSLVACLATEAIGKENAVGVFMPSEYTSEQSKEDAMKLADNLGINTLTIPINRVNSLYLSSLREFFENTKPDVTEENIQARIRGNILMAFSNKFDWMILATSNKSELATGYGTLYGDMAGGFAPLKDVYKTEVNKLASYYNSFKESEIIPKRIIEKPPSAELKPNQKDEDILPPYEILDTILRFFFEERFTPEEIAERGVDKEITREVLVKVKNSEYKRRQYCAGTKISRCSFGKDWRMPISNGYKK